MKHYVVVSSQILSGWNMLSVPNIVDDFAKTAVWSGANSSALTYIPGVGYVVKNILENRIGYWVSFSSVQTKNYVGFPLDSIHIPVFNVNNGWNLIGSISNDLQTSKIYSEPANIIASHFWGYNNGYYISDFIKKGKGYWVKVNNNGKIILDVNSTASFSSPKCSDEPSANPPGAPPKTTLLSPSNGATGLSTSLTLSWNASSDATSYSLQVSSDSCFTTFVLNDTNITTTSKYVGPLSYSTTYYWRVRPKNNIATGIWSNRWNFTIRNAPYREPCAPINELSAMDQFSITDKKGNMQSIYTHNGGRKLALGLNNFDMPPLPPKGIFDARFKSDNIPTVYMLFQNHSNPFNSETNISYSLPEAVFVTLKIYDVLGREVAVLVNEFKEAGVYEVVWDASSQPSGVYFYKLQSGNFVAVKKMLLVR